MHYKNKRKKKNTKVQIYANNEAINFGPENKFTHAIKVRLFVRTASTDSFVYSQNINNSFGNYHKHNTSYLYILKSIKKKKHSQKHFYLFLKHDFNGAFNYLPKQIKTHRGPTFKILSVQ